MRSIKLVLAALLTLGVAAAVALPLLDGEANSPSSSPASTTPLFATEAVQQSIGESLTSADLVIRAQVAQVGEPVWNSPDGRDWTDQYTKSPEQFVAAPISLTPVSVKVEELLREGKGAPQIDMGSTLTFLTLSGGLAPASDYLLMVDWTELYGSMEKPQQIWFGDPSQGAWLVQGEITTPLDQMQSYSLAGAIMSGQVKGSVDEPTFLGSVTIDTFKSILQDETETKAVDVAGFEEWPAEPAMEKAQEALNADDPEAHTDPSGV